MICTRYRHLLSRYVDGEVTPRQRAELLEHVQECADCAAWLARARQADVLLKGIPETRPSDHVREAIFGSIKRQPESAFGEPAEPQHRIASRLSTWRLTVAWFFMRFEVSAKGLAAGAAALLLVGAAGLAYWLNLIPLNGGYSKLGFEFPADSRQASVNSTPLPAISSGEYGVGGPVAVPNLVRTLPIDGAQGVPLEFSISARFDQPMDRASVEGSMKVDPPVGGRFVWDADNEVRFTPAAPGLLRGVSYTVSLSSTARSLAGTPLGKPITWSFRTRDPYGVISQVASGSTLGITSTLGLTFQVPMDRASTQISLVGNNSAASVPVVWSWDPSGLAVQITPTRPLPEGNIYLRVAGSSHTQNGDTLGKTYEFTYHVDLPPAHLRLLDEDGRLRIVGAQTPTAVHYEGSINAAGEPPASIALDVYGLPGEYMSALAAQNRPWPEALPAGLLDRLPKVASVEHESPRPENGTPVAGAGDPDAPALPPLPAGTYLLVATAPAQVGTISDWQLLVVEDGRLVQLDGGAFWATGLTGRSWPGAEISLYAPDGSLLEKGATDESGLWAPSEKARAARLAIARDTDGNVAAYDCGQAGGGCTVPAAPAPNDSEAVSISLQTDLDSYRPGQTINFRALVHVPYGSAQPTPLTEQQIIVSLLSPQGGVLSSLTLKPDQVGGVSGLFSLAPDAQPGEYTIRVQSGDARYERAVKVNAPSQSGLSIYMVPAEPQAASGAATITDTVSVLAARGIPAVGAVLTGTLRIVGDNWRSDPVVVTTDRDGRARLVVPLPAWALQYNDNALYLQVEARLGSSRGSAGRYLDLADAQAATSGTRELASPPMGLVAEAGYLDDGTVRLVARGLVVESAGAGGPPQPSGEVLVLAEAPSGETAVHLVDLQAGGETTAVFPRSFAGGRLLLYRAGVPGYREIDLLPAPSRAVKLQVTGPASVIAGAQVSLQMAATDPEGAGMAGTGLVWFRRASGLGDQEIGAEDALAPQGWDPNVEMSASGPVTATLPAPGSPGLWYVMAQAATPDGGIVSGWTPLLVLPGPSVQLSPRLALAAGETANFTLVVQNPGDSALSTGLLASADGAASLAGPGSQSVNVAAKSWQRVDWQVLAVSPGEGSVSASLTPGAGVASRWVAPVLSADNPKTTSSYASGVVSGERVVGVQVPSGLSAEDLQLEIRASTGLLPALAGAAAGASSQDTEAADQVDAVAGRLSNIAAVASAYRRAGQDLPDGVSMTPGERTQLLEKIYSAQHTDGGWGGSLNPAAPSTAQHTAFVLLALYRDRQLSGEGSHDEAVTKRALAYLAWEAGHPLDQRTPAAALDERAYELYVLSLYGAVQPEQVRAYLVYAERATERIALSDAGDAWLALALWQVACKEDAIALTGRLVESGSLARAGATTLAPALELLVTAGSAEDGAGAAASREPTARAFDAAAATCVDGLMSARTGAGWASAAETGQAVWALAGYAARASDAAQRGSPDITLNDAPVGMDTRSGDPNTVSVMVAGDSLHPGTNWLHLGTSAQSGRLYYSLTLRATR